MNGPCPACGWPVLTLKTTKRRGTEKVCPQQDCSYATPYEGDPADAEGPKARPEVVAEQS